MAINLPKEIKTALIKSVEELKPLFEYGVRFVSPYNWHLTISFLAYQDDNNVNMISEAIEEVTSELEAPEIRFEKIIYGPVGKSPRMIWLASDPETSDRLGKIKLSLENILKKKGVNFRQEYRRFNAHLTLARFQSGSLDSLPTIERKFEKAFWAVSLDLMESRLQRPGAEYSLLSSADFVK